MNCVLNTNIITAVIKDNERVKQKLQEMDFHGRDAQIVIPAKAGIQSFYNSSYRYIYVVHICNHWIPAFAGMTNDLSAY